MGRQMQRVRRGQADGRGKARVGAEGRAGPPLARCWPRCLKEPQPGQAPASQGSLRREEGLAHGHSLL